MEHRFREVAHTADVAIEVEGRNLAELFANAAFGMGHLLAEMDEFDPECDRPVDLEAPDVETLLVSWLNELLYLTERTGCVFRRFELLEITSTRLRANVHGGPAETYRQDIKAATFSDLEVKRIQGGYRTAIVFDV